MIANCVATTQHNTSGSTKNITRSKVGTDLFSKATWISFGDRCKPSAYVGAFNRQAPDWGGDKDKRRFFACRNFFFCRLLTSMQSSAWNLFCVQFSVTKIIDLSINFMKVWTHVGLPPDMYYFLVDNLETAKWRLFNQLLAGLQLHF